MAKQDGNNLAAASISALKWDYAGSAVRAASSMVLMVVLARLLGPEPFGLVAAAWLVIGLANLVADLGLGSALLQRGAISDLDVRYAFTMQACVGIALMAIGVLAGPVVGLIFKEPKVIPVLRAMSLVFVLQIFSGIAVCLMKREMDFKSIQVARITSYLVAAFGLGIPLAFGGFGVWSLVISQLFQTGLFSLLCYLHVRHPIRPLFFAPSSGLRQFGLKVLLTNIVNYSISNLDSFFIGRFFDVFVLGLYNRAYGLVSTPMNSVVVTVQQVSFSAYSRKQDDPETVRHAYIAGVGFMSILMLPLFGCVALVPGTIIEGLFGNRWDAAIPFLVPLALAMPFHAVMATGGPLLWANDRVGREFVAQIITALVFLIVLLGTSGVSPAAIVWGVFGVTVFRFVLITHASLRTVGGSWCRLAPAISGSMLLLICTGSIVFLSDLTLRLLEVPAFRRLVFELLIGAAAFLGTVLWMPKLILSREMHWLAEQLAEFLPTWMRPLMKRIAISDPVPA